MKILMVMMGLVTGQMNLDAFIRINDGKDRAGEVAVYRFTIALFSGSKIRTYLP